MVWSESLKSLGTKYHNNGSAAEKMQCKFASDFTRSAAIWNNNDTKVIHQKLLKSWNIWHPIKFSVEKGQNVGVNSSSSAKVTTSDILLLKGCSASSELKGCSASSEVMSLVKKKKAQQQNMRPLTIVRWANKPRNGNKSWLTTSGMLIVVNTSSSEPWDMFASNTYSLCWRKRSVAPALMSSTSVLLRISLYT